MLTIFKNGNKIYSPNSSHLSIKWTISCIEVIFETLCKLNYDTSRNFHQHHDNQPSPTDLLRSANTPMEVSQQTRQNIQTAQTRDTYCGCGVYSNIPIAVSYLLSKEQRRRSDRQLPPLQNYANRCTEKQMSIPLISSKFCSIWHLESFFVSWVLFCIAPINLRTACNSLFCDSGIEHQNSIFIETRFL